MGKHFVLIFSVLIAFSTLHGQGSPLSYKHVDSTTYAFYLQQDWKSLLELGKESKKKGIDFYYLKVRMGIAYFKEGKMLSAIKLLEDAYSDDNYNDVVQEYLYWAYRYSGLIMESQLFYTRMSKGLADKIKLDLPAVSSIDFGVLASRNTDYNDMLKGDINAIENEIRYYPEKHQSLSIGLNHPISMGVNYYHRLTLFQLSSIQQENLTGEVRNTLYDLNESRYYGSATFALGNRWYTDVYFNYIFGNYDDLNSIQGNNSVSSIAYSDFVFGVSLTKASFLIRNTINSSISNLKGLNQFQAGYTFSFYPLSNTLLVPFGSIQYQKESSNSNMVYTGGFSLNRTNYSIVAYGNTGVMNNFVSNNGLLIYNQSAAALNEIGLIIQFNTEKMLLKLGYSLMEMEGYYITENSTLSGTTYRFYQQNLIAGIAWTF